MLTHVVLFRLEDQADAAEAADRLNAMAGRIDRLVSISAGEDTTDGPWHCALVTVFTDGDALAAYQDDPVHTEVTAWLKPRIKDRAVVDFISPA